MKTMLRERELHSVCESLACPNRTECFSRGTATFMILGDICTR
jgi:lipoic acid synthetase